LINDIFFSLSLRPGMYSGPDSCRLEQACTSFSSDNGKT
jgi:hypothetical protein